MVVDASGKFIGGGFNSPVPGFRGKFPWTTDEKHLYIVHAEVAALSKCMKEAAGGTIYTTLAPCSQCAKLIALAKIKQVVYDDDKFKDREDFQNARKLLECVGIGMNAYND